MNEQRLQLLSVALSLIWLSVSTPITAGAVPPPTPQHLKVVGKLHGNAGEVAVFSPDDRVLLVGYGSQIRLWDVRTLQPLTPVIANSGWLGEVFFLDGGSRFVVGTDRGVFIRDTRTGQLVGKPVTFKQWVSAMTVSADAQLAAGFIRRSADANDGRIDVYDLATGQLKYQFATDNAVECLRISGSHGFLAALIWHSYHDDVYQLWRMSDGQPVGSPIVAGYQHYSLVPENEHPIAFSSDEKRVALALAGVLSTESGGRSRPAISKSSRPAFRE